MVVITSNLPKGIMVEMARRRHPGMTILDPYKVAASTLRFRTKEDGCGWLALHDDDLIRFDANGDLHIDVGPRCSGLTKRRLAVFLPAWATFSDVGGKRITTSGGSAGFRRRIFVPVSGAPEGDI